MPEYFFMIQQNWFSPDQKIGLDPVKTSYGNPRDVFRAGFGLKKIILIYGFLIYGFILFHVAMVKTLVT